MLTIQTCVGRECFECDRSHSLIPFKLRCSEQGILLLGLFPVRSKIDVHNDFPT